MVDAVSLFSYSDCDSLDNEISEWYTYSEEPEFLWNLKAFERQFNQLYPNKLWSDLTIAQRKEHILRLLNLCEINDKKLRMDVYRSILYIAQGIFKECEIIEQYNENLVSNVILLFECDVFSFFIELFYYEVETASAAQTNQPKTNPCLSDNEELRILTSVIYTMIEVIRTLPNTNENYKRIKENLRLELSAPNKNGEMLSTYLFGMILRFCNQNMVIFPIKKIILLLWKTLLFTLGGVDDIFRLKNERRERCGLPLITENPIEVLNKMSPAVPPPNPVDLVNELQNGSSANNTKKSKKNGLTKQTRGIDNDEFMSSNDYDSTNENNYLSNEDDVYPGSPRPKSPELNQNYMPFSQLRSLPWNPKVKQCELDEFIDQVRKKFLGYGDLPNDNETLIGLPYPIHESVRILKQHLYVSLSEHQLKQEDKILKYPLSYAENIDDTLTERLYTELLPNLSQYLVCLLRIILASVPQPRQKQESLQILSDLLPEDNDDMSQLATAKYHKDTNRHKEILIKAISAILLLMLKHLKINHVYQFECMCQHLLFANCMPLILKFFNLNITGFIHSKNNNVVLDFPNCVIGDHMEVTVEFLENGDLSPYRWRNVFSCINLLRILNKLTKYKRSRIMMLVIFKSAPTFKKLLRIKQTMLQYYALKLVKLQTKHLGRQWRKTNMTTLSAIYQKVRHRLNDDWVYGQNLDSQQWDFQADECALRTQIDRFNQRRYKPNEPLNADYIPVDHTFKSCMNTDVDIPNDFEYNYEQWLNDEVFSNEINWNLLLKDKNIPVLH